MPTTTKYIWDDQNYLAEADGSDTINVVYTNESQHYGNLVSTRIGSTTSYHHFDALGSTRQLTSSAKTVTDTAIYDAWGSIVSRSGTTGVRLLWVGETGYYSDTELVAIVVRARTYGPATARWFSLDPIGFANGMNRFVYVGNMPTLMIDSSGLSWVGQLCCYICMGPLAKLAERELQLAGVEDRDDFGGGNAFLHCVIACNINNQCPKCNNNWDNREDGTTIGGKQDLANNKAGRNAGKDCWNGCMDDWKNKGLTCQSADRKQTIPCPPPDKDYQQPPDEPGNIVG